MIGSSNAAAITEFLKARPSGATAMELAQHLNTSGDSAAQSMERMEDKGLVERGPGTRLSAVWTLKACDLTPPVFRAMQTLQAMQNAARQA